MKHMESRSNGTAGVVITIASVVGLAGCSNDSNEGLRSDVVSIRRAMDRVEENQETIQKEMTQRKDPNPELAEELKAIRMELAGLRAAEQEQRKELVTEIVRLQDAVAVREEALREIREAERLRQEKKDNADILDGKLAIRGRITYENEDGDRRPDRQARVLVFPQQRTGQRKLDITGLRSADSPEDFRSAAAAFRALGGDVTLVDEDGSFQISLPATGTYHILVLSNYQPRDTAEAIEASLLNLLSQYFDRSEQLLGRAAYHSAQIRYKGAEPVVWDHSF
jgi:hypothetical protein